MSSKYPGGLITKSSAATVGAADVGFGLEGGSAPGIWSLDQALALKSAGIWPSKNIDKKLWSWGRGDSRTGQNDIIPRSSPTQVGALTTWSDINTGQAHNILIKTDGTLWTWGLNGGGRLGDNTIIYRSSPVQIGTDTNWYVTGSCRNVSAAIRTNGTLWIWGDGTQGSIGNNAAISKSSPTQVGALTTWAHVSTADYSVYAITTSGTLFSWGTNDQGQLGFSTGGYRTSSPTQVGALTTWSRTDAGQNHCVALKTDGSLWTWGGNEFGGLGQNTTAGSVASPVQVGTLTTWSKIDAGVQSCYAIKTDGTMWVWGGGTTGQLGINNNADKSSPVQLGALTTWSKVSAKNQSVLALKTDGTLTSFGNNYYGTLGINAGGYRSSPIQVGAQVVAWSLAAGGNYTTMGLKADGTMWLWGNNGYGELGDDTVIKRSSPVQIGANATWSKIANGRHGMALKTDGTMWLWGRGDEGQIGDNAKLRRSSPVQLGALTTWSQIDCGADTSLALKTDGTMWAWGSNGQGQLAQDNRIYRSSPVQIGALTTWSKIDGAPGTSMKAIKTDGTLWAWCSNTGDNLTTTRSSPIQIGALTDWSLTSSSSYHCLAIKTNGTLWAWGSNGTGQGALGDNTTIDKSSPIQIGALTTWSLVSANAYHSMALKTDGTMWAWGKSANHGRLGDNTTISRSSPVQIGTLATWSKIAAGRNHSLAIETNGTWYSWGQNTLFETAGQLGDNTEITRSSPVQIGSTPTAQTANWAKIAAGGDHALAISAD